MQHFKMRPVSAVLVIVIVLLTYGASGESLPPTNGTEGACEVKDSTAICGEVFTWPENDNLTKIVVRSKLMTQLGKNDLEKYPNLETLDVSNSGLTKIDPDALTANVNLEELNLSGNKDLSIPDASSFISSKSLTHLNLSYIINVPETMILDLPNLQVLDLTSSSIPIFSSLSSLENLTTLIISENSTSDKIEICNATHLHQIIEVDNEKDNRTTFNCPDGTSKTIPVTTITTVESGKQKNTEIENTTMADKLTEISKDKTNITLETPQVSSPEKIETPNESTPKAPENSTDVPKIPGNSTEVPKISGNSTKGPKTPENSTETKTEIPKTPEEDSTKQIEIPPEPELPKIESPTKDENPTKDVKPTDEEKPVETKDTKPESGKTTPGKEEKAPLDNLIRFEIPPTPKDGNDKQNTHEDIKEQDTADVEAVMPQPSPSESNGVNIVLGIILTVMIVGALGFGYKYYKKRRSGYRNANTEDVEDGKELQNMVSHRDQDRTTSEQLTEQN